jgi:murein L,D-transpeptidase YafK
VDKSAHKAYLVKGGTVLKTYRCDLGWNSAEQKYFQGDGATPEGKYQITAVKHRSKYHKALLINYPNESDKKRFAENKRKGVISRYARIGALIEIHGGGGRDQDWTDGCIALTDRDMDNLLAYVSVGTAVTIVRRSDTWP